MDPRTSVMLSIAGSDSGAGAGIQADLKTASALGVYAATAVTAVTAQSTTEVRLVHVVPADAVAAQIDAVCADLRIGAVKIGLLPSVETVDAVADALARWRPPAIVLDPVLVASVGTRLTSDAVCESIRRRLLPLVELVTPNRAELARLSRSTAGSDDECRAAAAVLLAAGARWVLCKGGHREGPEAIDLLVGEREEHTFATPWVVTANGHGTGCTLSAAIAAGFVRGLALPAAVAAAKAYLSAGLRASDRIRLGAGPGPLHHFHRWWG